jgi:hypothetical protein
MKNAALATCLAACMTCGSTTAMDLRGVAALQQDLPSILRHAKSQPAPASTLLTDGNVQVDLASADWRGNQLAMLVLRDPSAAPRILAVVARTQHPPGSDVEYHWFPTTAKGCQPRTLDLAALEHLYRFAVNDAATHSYRFAAIENSAAARGRKPGTRLTHAQLLTRIAQARECVAGALRTSGTAAPKPWRMVSIESMRATKDPKHVAARVSDMHGPVAGATILFTREPHLECSGTTDRSGVAACVLEDTHGHDDHGEHEEAKTIAAYPGNVGPQVIMLPTTSVR